MLDGIRFSPDGYGGEHATRDGVAAGAVKWDADEDAYWATLPDDHAQPRRVRSLAEGRAYLVSPGSHKFPEYAPPRRASK